MRHFKWSIARRLVLAFLILPGLANCAAMGDVASAAYVGASNPGAGAALLVTRRVNAQMACRSCKSQCIALERQLDIAKCRIRCIESQCCRHGDGPI